MERKNKNDGHRWQLNEWCGRAGGGGITDTSISSDELIEASDQTVFEAASSESLAKGSSNASEHQTDHFGRALG